MTAEDSTCRSGRIAGLQQQGGWYGEPPARRPARPDPGPDVDKPRGPRPPGTPVVLTLVIANLLIHAFLPAQLFDSALRTFALWPLATGPFSWPMGAGQFEPWQLLSYGFLHGGLFHVGLNMLALWIFGRPLEWYWGPARFLFFYLFCVVGAGLVQLLVATQAAGSGILYPTVGASGGVFGVLLGFGMLFPNQPIQLLIPPIRLKAKYFVLGYGLFTLAAGLSGTMSGVAHFAHLGGMVFGFFLIQYWRGRWPFGRG